MKASNPSFPFPKNTPPINTKLKLLHADKKHSSIATFNGHCFTFHTPHPFSLIAEYGNVIRWKLP